MKLDNLHEQLDVKNPRDPLLLTPLQVWIYTKQYIQNLTAFIHGEPQLQFIGYDTRLTNCSEHTHAMSTVFAVIGS